MKNETGFDGEVHIASFVLHSDPVFLSRVEQHLSAMSDVEIHASDASGKIVVTVEKKAEAGVVICLDEMRLLDGVHAVNLVYHHAESEHALSEELNP